MGPVVPARCLAGPEVGAYGVLLVGGAAVRATRWMRPNRAGDRRCLAGDRAAQLSRDPALRGLESEAADELLDAVADLVADGADGVDALAGGVVERPVLVALAGEDRAGVAAAHRDDDVGGPDDLVGPRLRVSSAAMSMPTSAIASTAAGLTSVGRLGAAGADDDAVAGEVVRASRRPSGSARRCARRRTGPGGRGSGHRSASWRCGCGRVGEEEADEAKATAGADELHDDEHRRRRRARCRRRCRRGCGRSVTAGLAKLVDDVNQ